MVFNTLFITFFSWTALLGYLVCFIPQIIKNYHLKSTAGWSNSFILMYFFGSVSLTFYVFCLNLPFAYKILVPLEASLMLIIIFQRLYYDRAATRKFFLPLFCSLNVLSLLMLPVAASNLTLVGDASGWVSFILFTIYSIPQTIKIFKQKSVKGFSLGYLHVFTFATLCELAVALTGVLPIQSVVTILKNMITSFIFYIQFWLYGKNSH